MKNGEFADRIGADQKVCHCWALWRRMVVAAFLLCSHQTHFLFVYHQVQPTLSEKSLRKCDAASRRLWQQAVFSAFESDHLDQLSTFLAFGAVGPYVAEMTSCKVTEACRGAPRSVFTHHSLFTDLQSCTKTLCGFLFELHISLKKEKKKCLTRVYQRSAGSFLGVVWGCWATTSIPEPNPDLLVVTF